MPGSSLKFKAAFVNIGRFIHERCSIDSRALALFRIIAGVLIIADVTARSGRFTYFYTEQGVVPRSLAQFHSPDYAFSFFFFSTNAYVTAALFILHVVIAVFLILGYQTRVATIVSFLFVISLDNRNPLILSYADTLFRLLLFWAMFLPLGERWSVDALKRDRPIRQVISGLAPAAILIQMIVMYLVNAIQKTGGELWRSGDATPDIFGLDHMTWLLGDFMRQFPSMLEYGGWAWYSMLWASWLLIVSPGRMRLLLIAAFMVAHASFLFTVRIGAFPYVAIAGVCLFLREPFWSDAQRLLRPLLIGRWTQKFTRQAIWSPASRIIDRLPAEKLNPGIPEGYVRRINTGIVACLLIITMVLPPLAAFQDAGVYDLNVRRVEQPGTTLAQMFRFTQPPWTIFAPTPRHVDRYYVFPAETNTGEVLDIYNDRLLSWERPFDTLQVQYKTYRERFYMDSIETHDDGDPAAKLLAEYLCNSWETARGATLTHLNMYVVNEQITRDTIDKPHERETWTSMIYRHGCDGNLAPVISAPGF